VKLPTLFVIAGERSSKRALAHMQTSVANSPKAPAAKRREATWQRERKIAKKPVSSIVLVARQPYFGWFGSRIW